MFVVEATESYGIFCYSFPHRLRHKANTLLSKRVEELGDEESLTILVSDEVLRSFAFLSHLLDMFTHIGVFYYHSTL